MKMGKLGEVVVDAARKVWGLGEAVPTDYVVNELINYVEQLEAKIDRLEKAAMMNCGEDHVEQWRTLADEEHAECDVVFGFLKDGSLWPDAPPITFKVTECGGLIPDGALAETLKRQNVTRPVPRCTGCGEPNEYQDGPFTCHSCRSR